MRSSEDLAAEAAREIAARMPAQRRAQLAGLATRALSLLRANGVYAATLFLCARAGQPDATVAATLRQGLLALAPAVLPGAVPPADGAAAAEVMSFVGGFIADDLEALLLITRLWEQTLSHLRRGARAGR